MRITMGIHRVPAFLSLYALIVSGEAVAQTPAANPPHHPSDPSGRRDRSDHSDHSDLLDLADTDDAIVLFAPKLSTLFEVIPNLANAVEPFAGDIEPALISRGRELISALGKPTDGPQRGSLLGAAILESAGFDVSEPLLVTWRPRDKALVAVFGLSNRDRLEALLKHQSDAEANTDLRLHISGTDPQTVWLIDATTDTPIACVLGTTQGYCQFGTGPRSKPLRPLQATFERGLRHGPRRGESRRASDRGPADTPTEDPDKPLSMFSRVRAGGVLYLIANMKTLAATLVDFETKRLRRAHQFGLGGRAEREHEQLQERAMRHSAGAVTRLTDRLVAALYVEPRQTALEAKVSLTREGRAFFARAVRPQPQQPDSQMIDDWASTPALAKLILRLHPRMLEQHAKILGIDLPEGLLTGELAVLWLGLDSECPAAKAPPARTNWPFVLPTALALDTENDPKPLAKSLRKVIRDHTQRTAEPPQAVEVATLEHTVLLGTGRGAGAAALRRLLSVRTKQETARASRERAEDAGGGGEGGEGGGERGGGGRRERAFLEASLDFLAIDAALGAIMDSSAEPHSNLHQLVQARERLRPAFEAASHVGLEVTLTTEEAQEQPGLHFVLHADD